MRNLILERFPVFGRLVVALAVAGTPVVVSPLSLDLFNLAKVTFLWIAALIAAWLWFCWSLERRFWLPRSHLVIAGGAFLAAYGLATILSQNRVNSVIGVYHRYGGFLPMAIYVLIALMTVVFFWEHPARLRHLAVAVLAGSVPVSGYALIQAAGLDWVAWWKPAGGRPEFPGSTLGNSNFVGGYLGIALPFISYLLLSVEQRNLRPLIGLVAAGAVAALWVSGSRGGLMAAAGGLICMALVFRQLWSRWMKAGIVALVASGLVLAILIVWHPGMESPPAPLQKFNVFRTDTFRLRSQYWAAAWRIFMDNPLWGAGPDTFGENYPTYHLPLSAQDAASGSPDKPHNIYLELASSSGLLGLGAYLTLIGLAIKYAMRRARADAGSEKLLLAAFAGGLGAYLVQGFFSMDVAPLAMMSWISLAGLAVLSDPRLLAERALREKSVAKQAKKQSSKLSAGETAAHQTAGSVQKRRAFQVAGAGLALAMMAFGLRPLLADVAARTGMRKSSSMEEALGHLMRADKLNPWTSTYQVMPTTLVVRQARSLPEDSQEGVFQQAHHWLEGVAKNTPSNQFAAMNLARVNEFWAAKNSATRYPVAHRWWRRAVELNPSAWRLKLKYGAFLGDWALQTDDAAPKQAALSVLRDLSESEPGRPEVWLALGKAYVLRGDINRAKIALDEALRIRPEYLEARTWRQRLHVPERPPSTAGPAPAS